MKSTFKILFYARKNQVNNNGEVGIMIRVSVNGENTQFSSKLQIHQESWDPKRKMAVGRSNKANLINSILDDIRASLTSLPQVVFVWQQLENESCDQVGIQNVFGYKMLNTTQTGSRLRLAVKSFGKLLKTHGLCILQCKNKHCNKF